jgi:regulatory protein
MMNNSEYTRAKERALYILEARDHSYAELYAKLEKNYSEEVCFAVCDKMTEIGLINDSLYAKKLAKYYFTVKKYGKYRAFNEMKRKGLDITDIEEASEEYLYDLKDSIRELIEKKYYKYLDDEKGVIKAKNALVRLGFTYDDINSVMEEFLNEGNF